MVGCIRLDVASKTHAGAPTSGHHGYMAYPSLSVVVTSLHHIADALDQFKPDFVVSILSAKERSQFRAPQFGSRRVLKLDFEDSERADNALGPTRSDIERLIAFAREEWRGRGPMLCQCRAGVARSSAAGLIAAAVLRPTHPEFLARVARAKAYFKPNTTMLRLADDVLGTSLVELVRGLPPPDRRDEWGPAYVPLDR